MKNTLKTLSLILSIFFFISCKEKPVPPIISTTTITEISATTAVSGGKITADGGSTIISKGVCWNTLDDPTIKNSKTIEDKGLSSFISNLTQLNPRTLYYVRAYATNSAGTGYGESLSLTTLGSEPVCTAGKASNITINSATLNGTVNPNSLLTTISFEWGKTSSYGNIATPTQNSFNGSIDVSVSNEISGLTMGTTYHYRIKATNELGTTNSNDITFISLDKPILTTHNVSNTTPTSASCGGTITTDFEAPIIEQGICWNTSPFPTVVDNKVVCNPSDNDFSVDLTGLIPNTTYYLRAYATNSVGTGYGNEQIFRTFTGTIIDIEGNNYNTVAIGTQIWMAENLKTTKYSNGDLIGTTNPATLDILNQSTPKYQWAYSGTENNVATYGRLYTWYAITDSRKVCPTGWHIPSYVEWLTLTNYLGGVSIAGGKLKEAGTINWSNPNTGATNEFSFTAHPGGSRNSVGTFSNIGKYGLWWSATEDFAAGAWAPVMNYDNVRVDFGGGNKRYGFSVRCIKD